MRIKGIIFVLVLLLASSLSAVSFWRQNFYSRLKKTVQKNNFPLKTNRLQGSLLHWDSEVSPNGLYQGDSYTGDYANYFNYFQLFITNLATGNKQKVYAGDFRTLGWEWTDDNKIKIEYDCGSGCLATKILGTNESVSVADYQDGKMSEENGWKVKFTKSF